MADRRWSKMYGSIKSYDGFKDISITVWREDGSCVGFRMVIDREDVYTDADFKKVLDDMVRAIEEEL